MRAAAVLLCLAMTALGATPRTWVDAEVANITTGQRTGYAVLPLGGGLIGAPLTAVRYFYWIQTPDKIICVSRKNQHPLNLTLHGKTKIAIDGSRAYVLDDDGKEVKMDIMSKAMRPKPDAGAAKGATAP